MATKEKTKEIKKPGYKNRDGYIEDIAGSYLGGQYRPMITDISFWNYKNIKDGSKLEFGSPVSLLVGSNGTNKTSILRALQGSVAGDSLSNYWFDSKLDLIPGDTKKRPKYVYSYSLPISGKEEKRAQVMYQRIYRQDREEKDYFETVPPASTRYMDNVDFKNLGNQYSEYYSESRWSPLNKNVCYIDIRDYPSAYDVNMKFALLGFILDSKEVVKAESSRGYKRVIQAQKSRVRSASDQIFDLFNIEDGAILESDLKFSRFLKDSKIEGHCEPPVYLGGDEIEWISYILGRKYRKISLLNHSLFGLPGTTVKVDIENSVSGDMGYSEAYAGSGEYAVIMMVHFIFSAPEKSLILMDEPENSLHPESQRRLMEYILMMSIAKKHQFVISTHSAYMAEGMDDKSIHHLYRNKNGSVEFESNVSSRDAFIGIGGAPDTAIAKVTIKVEDKLAAAVVKRALRAFCSENSLNKYDVEFFGSCSTALDRYIPSAIESNSKDTLWILDGDSNRHNKNGIISRLEEKLGPVYGYEYYACRVALYYVSNIDKSQGKKPKAANGYDVVEAYLTALEAGNPANIKKCLSEVNKKVNNFVLPKGDSEKERALYVQSVFAWLEKHVQYLPGAENPEAWILQQLNMGDYVGNQAKKEIASHESAIREFCELMPSDPITSDEILRYQIELLKSIDDKAFEPVYEIIKGFDN